MAQPLHLFCAGRCPPLARTTWYGPRINRATARIGVEARRIAEKSPLGNVRVLCHRNDDRPFMHTSVEAFGVQKRCDGVQTDSNVDGDMSTFEQLPLPPGCNFLGCEV